MRYWSDRRCPMLPRRELNELLEQRLRGLVPGETIAQLADEIAGLETEWEEVEVTHRDMGYSVADRCSDICWLAEQIDRGAVMKFYRKKKSLP
jgi:hypothetical protein